MTVMPNSRAALAAQAILSEDRDDARLGAQVVDLDDVAQRRERLLAYAAASAPVIVYRFMMAPGASAPALGQGGGPRDARAQLELIVGLTGGGLTRSPGGLAARIPKISAGKFERLAGPLIAQHLVSLDLGEGVSQSGQALGQEPPA